MKVFVHYSFEIDVPDVEDTMTAAQANSLAKELAQNINFQEVQKAYTKDLQRRFDVYITKIRSTRIEEW